MHACFLQCLAMHTRMNPPKYHSQTVVQGTIPLHCLMIPDTTIQSPPAANAAATSPIIRHLVPHSIFAFAIKSPLNGFISYNV